MMKYGGFDLYTAGAEAIEALGTIGGSGGLVSIDKNGNVAAPFNSPGHETLPDSQACTGGIGPGSYHFKLESSDRKEQLKAVSIGM